MESKNPEIVHFVKSYMAYLQEENVTATKSGYEMIFLV